MNSRTRRHCGAGIRVPRRWSLRAGTLAKDESPPSARACQSACPWSRATPAPSPSTSPRATRGRFTCRWASARSPAALTLPAGRREQRHRQRGIGVRASRPGRERRGPGHDDQQHSLGEPVRQLRVLQPARATLHRRVLSQHQNTGAATLIATSPASLVNATGNTIPFTQIRWTSSGNGDTGAQPFPAGAFVGGVQTIGSISRNQWAESCHTFTYSNSAVVAAGTYTGRVTYTLSTP